MHYLIALIYFVLALVGLDGYGSQTLVTRSVVNGAEVLYSKATMIGGVADITCVRSASGSCRYRLMAGDCGMSRPRAAAASACAVDPGRQFVLAPGASREIAGLPARFTLCVDPGRGAAQAVAVCETLPAWDALALNW